MDEDLKKELEGMRIIDQATRQEAMEVVRAHGIDSPEYAALRIRGRALDAKHQTRLVQIVEKHGWPGKSLVGEFAAGGAFLILQHGDVSTQEKYLPLVRDAAAAGDVDPSQLAMLEDRVLMARGKPQLYGTQIARGPDGRPSLWPIAEESQLADRRKRMGLEPLVEYLKRFGIEPPRTA
jgi:hypothetical protein